MMATKKETERDEAIATLREWLNPGDTVYTILRHVSASGMSRSISLVIVRDDPGDYRPVDVTYWAARAMGAKIDVKYGGIKIGGAGMDMGFSLVYSLSRRLFADGFTCTGNSPRCPSKDHINPPYPERDGAMLHSDPGYALVQRWI